MKIDLGDPLNPNKNPLGEAAIAELKRELLALAAHDTPLDQALLSLAVKNLNSRKRAGGQSAMERLMQRDQLTNKSLTVNEEDLKEELEQRRQAQHLVTERKIKERPKEHFKVGDLVILKALSRLDRPRDLFIVAEDFKDGFLKIRKSEKQWRHKTYRVKPSQLLKVFNSDETESSPAPESEGNVDIVKNPQKTSRQAKLKARLTMQQQSRSCLVNIKERLKKKYIERKFVDLVFHFPPPIPASADISGVTEDSDHDLSLTEDVSEESVEFQEQSTAPSVTTMGDTCREILQSHFNKFSDNPSEASCP